MVIFFALVVNWDLIYFHDLDGRLNCWSLRICLDSLLLLELIGLK